MNVLYFDHINPFVERCLNAIVKNEDVVTWLDLYGAKVRLYYWYELSQ